LFVSFCFENLQKGNMENTTVQPRPAIRGGIGILAHASAGIWLRQYCQKEWPNKRINQVVAGTTRKRAQQRSGLPIKLGHTI
jgi:hypothetical protein